MELLSDSHLQKKENSHDIFQNRLLTCLAKLNENMVNMAQSVSTLQSTLIEWVDTQKKPLSKSISSESNSDEPLLNESNPTSRSLPMSVMALNGIENEKKEPVS